MRKTRLAPGEREEAALHPAFASTLPWHVAGLGFAAFAALLSWLLQGDGWAGGSSGSPWRFWNYLYGNRAVAYLLVAAAFGLAGSGFSRLLGRPWPLACGLGLAAAFAAAVEGTWGGDYARGLPLLVAAATPASWILTEADRRSRTYHLTNLRLVAHGGLVRRREESVHYDAVVDLDARRGPWARLFDHATLVPVLRAAKKGDGRPAPRFPGFHPYGRMRRALEALIQEATAGPVMRNTSGLNTRVADALADLQRDAGGSERL